MIFFETWVGAFGFIIQFFGQFQYFHALFVAKTAKPHAFTWLVWSFIMGIGAVAQFSAGEGWAIIFLAEGSLFCFIVGLIALWQQKIIFTQFDYLCLFLALLALPLWGFTNTPLYSVVLISFIDGLMMLPTIRKTWNEPFSEPLGVFITGSLVSLSSLLVLQEISIITAAYPIAIIFFNIAFIMMVLLRRKFIYGRSAKVKNFKN